MALKIDDSFAADRMVAIYQWALDQGETFKLRECSGYRPDSINNQAVRMLINRKLIKAVGNTKPSSYQVDRIVNIQDCLTPFDAPSVATVTRYRVPVSVARSMGKSPNLQQYSI
jgi:hypothetical protein